jgi:methylmalonyl-CoA mutase
LLEFEFYPTIRLGIEIFEFYCNLFNLLGGENMSLKEMIEQSFPHYHFDEWKEAAEESLKGRKLQSLQRTTYENIVLKPLYTSEDEKAASEFPGGGDFRRGIDSLGYVTNKWKVAQRISYKSLEELQEKLQLALKSGQSAVSFELSNELIEAEGVLSKLIQDYNEYPLAIDAGEFQSKVLSLIAGCKEGAKVTGYVAADPLSAAAAKGSDPDKITGLLEQWAESVKQADKGLPNLRTVLINAIPYHNGGANAVQELGIAAATGVFYLNQLSDLELEQALDKMIFKFSIGSNFFMEIAKLRAARILWSKITEVYGADETKRGLQIAAETSMFTKTVYDSYVNLLRGGNEAFAAVVGGVQYLHVNPFDELTGSSPFSERIARNTQLILQEEAHLQKAIDPAGGSWYVEALTNELAQKAWEFFQEIDANGGILEVLKTNWLQEKIAEVYEKRKQDIFSRKQSIIGTNVYANLDDLVPETTPSSEKIQNGGSAIKPIAQLRLSQPYEELRKRAEILKQKSGIQPQVGLICLGSLKQHKARMDFVRGFLSAGGVSVLASEPIQTAEEAKVFMENASTKHFCICGTNDHYQTLGLEVLQLVNAEFADQSIYLAGLPDKEDQVTWEENKLKQFIHVKSNCYETISSILSEMEVSLNEQVQA